MKTWLIAASVIGGIFASDIIRLSAVILKKNMEADGMPEYIEREALKERFRKRIKWLEKDVHDQYSLGLFHGCEYDADLINEPPAADVAPVRHGRWITTSGQAFPWSSQLLCYFHKHEECGFQYVDMKENGYNFCPHCGAKMDGE